ncbi:hypothetical protein [Opitutus sp. ER46]|uniref:hypothetical protein n=1 Tax=Opitutus sp. ER46 TaxID=2161864 RepID=UPI000D30F06C|nr:hypothetical protein [Opitutus sp. ER46]PTX91235.1 hypothetical protein DB354_21635 [Opitutus sp. ER46]
MRLAIKYAGRELRVEEARFVGGCAELMWREAGEALLAAAPLTFAMVTQNLDLSEALQTFAMRAPATDIERARRAVTDWLRPGEELAVDSSRTRGLVLLSLGHLHWAAQHAARGHVGEAHAHTAAAVSVRARTLEHESLLIGGFDRLARLVGEVEGLADGRPLSAEFAGITPVGYSPEILPDLIERLVDGGASEGGITCVMESLVRRADWSSVRALSRTGAVHRAVLGPIVQRILFRMPDLSARGRAQLLYLAQGLAHPTTDAG